MTFDPATDFRDVVDGLEPITLLRRGGAALTIAHALRRSMSTREAAAGDGGYTASDVRWKLPQDECPQEPQIGEAILDAAGSRWTVLAVSAKGPTACWDCTCRNMAVAHRLDDVVGIEQAEYAQGSGGALAATWHTWRTGVRARIQPVSAQVDALHEARQTVKRYRIFLAEDLALDHRHRIRAADGTLYRVLSSSKAQQIGELPAIEAEEL